MKLYIVEYCCNEHGDSYNSPHPIYYSLDEYKANDFFKKTIEEVIEDFNECIDIVTNTDNEFEYNFENYNYKYILTNIDLDKKLYYR